MTNQENQNKCPEKGQNNRQLKKINYRITAWGVINDFVSNTGLHGFRYLSERITIIEKIFWLLTLTCSLGMCSYQIYNVWDKWQHSPVIVTFNEKAVPVWKVPFPAITICPQTKCLSSKFNYSQAYSGLTDLNYLSLDDNTKEALRNDSNITRMFSDLNLVCSDYLFEIDTLRSSEHSDASTIKNIRSVAPTVEQILKGCAWRGKTIECSTIFKEVLTSSGVCYTFNALAENEMFNLDNIQKEYKYLYTTKKSNGWSMEKGYAPIKVEGTFPEIGRDSGAEPDLRLLLVTLRDEKDTMCNSLRSGFEVYLHHPADMPQKSQYYYSVLPSQLTALAARFSMLTTSNSLKDYLPERRQCYFPIDRKLKYFKEYTQKNCELECLTNHTLNKCGCVWFHMPHEHKTNICNINDVDCTRDAKEDITNAEVEHAYRAEGSSKKLACKCLPMCDSISYDAEVLKTIFDMTTYMEPFKNFWNTTESYSDLTSLEVYFKESRFVSMRRAELFGVTDFLANCGGLLGLFLGFSFLSLIEIIYFPTLRLWCSMRRQKIASNEAIHQKEI